MQSFLLHEDNDKNNFYEQAAVRNSNIVTSHTSTEVTLMKDVIPWNTKTITLHFEASFLSMLLSLSARSSFHKFL